MKTNNFIKVITLLSILSSNALADEIFSKAIYDSKLNTLSLEGVLVPFIDEFTGKETDNKGIFDVQLEEKTKLVFELIPWSITNKNMFDGENTSGYILYDHKTRFRGKCFLKKNICLEKSIFLVLKLLLLPNLEMVLKENPYITKM